MLGLIHRLTHCACTERMRRTSLFPRLAQPAQARSMKTDDVGSAPSALWASPA